MIPVYIKKIRNIFNYLQLSILLFFVKLGKRKINARTLLIIRLDSIGDYVVFRNFLGAVKNSKQYKEYKITLCGNITWKNLAENLDSGSVDNFMWIDRKRFYKKIKYRYEILREIYKNGYEVVIETTYTREILFGDSIVKASNARIRIGSEGALDKHAKWKRELVSDKYYTKLLPAKNNNLFEFYRNTEFFQQLLNTELNIRNTSIDLSGSKLKFKLPDKYVVMFPGSSDIKRRWSPENFSIVSNYIIKKYSLKIVIPLSKNEKEIAGSIIKNLPAESFIDLTGQTDLLDLAKILHDASLLITNDTSAMHFAAAVSTRFICISNGSYFGRFHPYPDEIFSGAYYVYPDEIMKNISNIDELNKLYRFGSDLDINSIRSDSVINLIDKLIQ